LGKKTSRPSATREGPGEKKLKEKYVHEPYLGGYKGSKKGALFLMKKGEEGGR